MDFFLNDYVEPELPKRITMILETDQYRERDRDNWDEIRVTETRGEEEWLFYSEYNMDDQRQLVLSCENRSDELREIVVYIWACSGQEPPKLLYGHCTELSSTGNIYFEVDEQKNVHQLFDECDKFHAQVFFLQMQALPAPNPIYDFTLIQFACGQTKIFHSNCLAILSHFFRRHYLEDREKEIIIRNITLKDFTELVPYGGLLPPLKIRANIIETLERASELEFDGILRYCVCYEQVESQRDRE